MKKTVAVVAAVVLSLALAACGSGGQMPAAPPGQSGMTNTIPGAPPQEPGQVIGGKVVVNIKDLKFIPSVLRIPQGATVVYANADNIPHSVTKKSGPGPDFDSGPLDPGGTFSQSFTNLGVYKIIDKDRPSISMKLTVVKR